MVQLLEEDYLRWDSLGEFLALAEALRHVAGRTGNARAAVLASALDEATEALLDQGKSPARRLGQIDNRGSHAWLALLWAEALAAQSDDADLAAAFAPVAARLRQSIATIDAEMLAVQGSPVEIGGYYRPDPALTDSVMRPSATFNAVIDAL